MQELITKKELEELVNKLDNGIDKFILLGFYYGLNGSASYKEQLLNLEVDSVDFENKKINLPDSREVLMDALLEKVCKEAINQKIYVKLGNKGGTNEDYLLNPDSKYVIKVKPIASNLWGIQPLKYTGFRTKYANIRKKCDLEVNPSELETSGLINELLAERKDWTVADIQFALKIRNTPFNAFRLYSIMKEILG